MTFVRKLWSPAGFVLVGLLFLVPFVAVSCGNEQNVLTTSYTGADFLTGGKPTLDFDLPGETVYQVESSGGSVEATLSDWRTITEPAAIQPLLLVALMFVAAGVAAAFLRRPRPRALVGAGGALTALVFTVIGGLLGGQAVKGQVLSLLGKMSVPAEQRDAYFTVRPAVGFWLALTVLLALAAGHGYDLVRLSRPAAASIGGDDTPSDVHRDEHAHSDGPAPP